MSPDEIADMAYWHLVCGEDNPQRARLRVMRLCAALLNQLDDVFPEADLRLQVVR